jgi:hypothetical protein
MKYPICVMSVDNSILSNIENQYMNNHIMLIYFIERRAEFKRNCLSENQLLTYKSLNLLNLRENFLTGNKENRRISHY